MITWPRDSVFYHIYPLGMCGAPLRNDFASPPKPRLQQLHQWIPHLREMGVTALYLGPLFESTAHGYDTTDYYWVDRRLGTNETLAHLVRDLHDNDIRTVLDGVFHHVGRDFWAFRDLREKGEKSEYRDWFQGINFSTRSPHGDPFTYDAWRGHYDLVKLNLKNPAVREHLFEAVRTWVDQFGIDGLRLDVAEDIDLDFLGALAHFCRTSFGDDFWLLGEVIHGDYRRWANPGPLHSVTNYEVYKGLYSSHNDKNYHELSHSLQRQYGDGGMYKHLHLYNFADNHDVDRVASILKNPAHLPPLYALLFTIPGIPSIYYGSEWGQQGNKKGGDDGPLRPALHDPGSTAAAAPAPDLRIAIAQFAQVRQRSLALRAGSYHQLHVAQEQIAFLRHAQDDMVVVAVNASASRSMVKVPVSLADGTDFVDQLDPNFKVKVHGGHLTIDAIPPHWARILSAPVG